LLLENLIVTREGICLNQQDRTHLTLSNECFIFKIDVICSYSFVRQFKNPDTFKKKFRD